MHRSRRILYTCLFPIAPLFLLGVLAPTAANADFVIFNNGAPNQHGGSDMTDFLESEDFTLAQTSSISGITFWNFQLVSSDYKGSLYWAFQADSAGAPGAILASGTTSAVSRAATGLKDTSGMFSEFIDGFNIPSITLSPGKYWLTLHDGDIADNNFADFYWEWTADNGDSQGFDLVANSGWNAALSENAFQLTPEPQSVLLLVTIVGALGLVKFRLLNKA